MLVGDNGNLVIAIWKRPTTGHQIAQHSLEVELLHVVLVNICASPSEACWQLWKVLTCQLEYIQISAYKSIVSTMIGMMCLVYSLCS